MTFATQNTGHPNVVEDLESLRAIKTQGIGDVRDSAMVTVRKINYAEMVGSSYSMDKSGVESSETTQWLGPSDGYVELRRSESEYLRSTFSPSSTSLVDPTGTGTTVSIWFKPYSLPSIGDAQSILHIPTLSSDGGAIEPFAGPTFKVRGMSLHLAIDPDTSELRVFYTISTHSPYEGDGVSGPLLMNSKGWVPVGVDLMEWHHVVMTLNRFSGALMFYVNGTLSHEVDLMANFVISGFNTLYVNGENLINEHEILLGCSRDEDNGLENHFDGELDEFSYHMAHFTRNQARSLYGNGSVGLLTMNQASYPDGVLYWPLGDDISNWFTENLVIMNQWSGDGGPNVSGTNMTPLGNIKSRDQGRQYDIVRIMSSQGDLTAGYKWVRSYPPLKNLDERAKSHKSVLLSNSDAKLAFLDGPIATDDAWSDLDALTKGDIAGGGRLRVWM